MDFPGENTGGGCHSLLQGIFPAQGSNPGLLHCRWTLYCLSHQGSTKIVYPGVGLFSSSFLTLHLASPVNYTLKCYVPFQSLLMLSHFSRVQLFATAWTVALQAPLSIGFSRQEHWRGLPFPSPGDLPDPGTEPMSPALQEESLPAKPPGKPVVECFQITSWF